MGLYIELDRGSGSLGKTGPPSFPERWALMQTKFDNFLVWRGRACLVKHRLLSHWRNPGLGG